MRIVRDDDQDDIIDDRATSDDHEPEVVQCPKCGKAIWAYARKCPKCGIHFAGEAWQFADNTGRKGTSNSLNQRLGVIVVVLVILAFALSFIL